MIKWKAISENHPIKFSSVKLMRFNLKAYVKFVHKNAKVFAHNHLLSNEYNFHHFLFSQNNSQTCKQIRCKDEKKQRLRQLSFRLSKWIASPLLRLNGFHLCLLEAIKIGIVLAFEAISFDTATEINFLWKKLNRLRRNTHNRFRSKNSFAAEKKCQKSIKNEGRQLLSLSKELSV